MRDVYLPVVSQLQYKYSEGVKGGPNLNAINANYAVDAIYAILERVFEWKNCLLKEELKDVDGFEKRLEYG